MCSPAASYPCIITLCCLIGCQSLAFSDLPLEGRVADCSARSKPDDRDDGADTPAPARLASRSPLSPAFPPATGGKRGVCRTALGDGYGGDYSLRLLPRADMGRESTARAGGGVCGCVRGASEARQRPRKRALTRGPIHACRQRRLRQRCVRGASEGDPNPSSVVVLLVVGGVKDKSAERGPRTARLTMNVTAI